MLTQVWKEWSQDGRDVGQAPKWRAVEDQVEVRGVQSPILTESNWETALTSVVCDGQGKHSVYNMETFIARRGTEVGPPIQEADGFFVGGLQCRKSNGGRSKGCGSGCQRDEQRGEQKVELGPESWAGELRGGNTRKLQFAVCLRTVTQGVLRPGRLVVSRSGALRVRACCGRTSVTGLLLEERFTASSLQPFGSDNFLLLFTTGATSIYYASGGSKPAQLRSAQCGMRYPPSFVVGFPWRQGSKFVTQGAVGLCV